MTTANQRRQLEGIVVSDRMAKTRVVSIERAKFHPKYKKAYRVHSRYKVHDPSEVSHVGDRVLFEECRPISKDKRWVIVKRIESQKA